MTTVCNRRNNLNIYRPKILSIYGFTLIELLVALAIIVVLALLLFPFIKSSINRAHGAKCAGNLRRLGAATADYMADNNGFLPIAFRAGSNGKTSFSDADGAYWYWLLAPYVNVPRWDTVTSYLGPQGHGLSRPCIFTCPSHAQNEPLPLIFPSKQPVSYAPPIYVSRIMQKKQPRSATETLTVWGMRLIDVKEPTRKVWLSDSTHFDILNVGPNRWLTPDISSWARIAFSRHDKAGNALFYDGHVERILYDAVVSGDLNKKLNALFDPSTETE